MNALVILLIFFVVSFSSLRAESSAPDGESQTPSTSGSDPSGEIWSKPEPGRSREDAPSVSATPEPTPAPAPRFSAPPASEGDSGAYPQIWSRPEPGYSREQSPIPEPPPPYWEPRHPRWYSFEPDSGEPLKEFGLTIGPPAIVNFNLGYWGSRSFPLLVRLSGMYYGASRGIQLDIGYAFSREARIRQYFALSAISYQTAWNFYSFWNQSNVSSYTEMFTGVGPTYGINWNGLSLQVGVAFGQDVTAQSWSGGYYGWQNNYSAPGSSTVSQFIPLFIFQLGYTFLW